MNSNIRKLFFATLALFAIPMLSIANSDHHHDHSTHDHSTPEGMAAHQKMMDKTVGSQQSSTNPAQEKINGEVRKIDKTLGTITLKHEALPTLNMPAMTMVFEVKKREWLDEFNIGDKVTFNSDRLNGRLIITEISKRN